MKRRAYTAAERQEARRVKKRAEGRTRLELWVRPENRAEVIYYAQILERYPCTTP